MWVLFRVSTGWRDGCLSVAELCVSNASWAFTSPRAPTSNPYLAGEGAPPPLSVCCGARGAGGKGVGGIWNVCLCSPSSFPSVGVHGFKKHLGNAFQQMEALTGVSSSKIRLCAFVACYFNLRVCLLAHVLFSSEITTRFEFGFAIMLLCNYRFEVLKISAYVSCQG